MKKALFITETVFSCPLLATVLETIFTMSALSIICHRRSKSRIRPPRGSYTFRMAMQPFMLPIAA